MNGSPSFHVSYERGYILAPMILIENKIEQRGTRTVDGVDCHEYRVTYIDLVNSDEVVRRDIGTIGTIRVGTVLCAIS
jgi:hypothetical protein